MKTLKVGESVTMNGAEKLKTFHNVSKMINNLESCFFLHKHKISLII